MVYEKHSSAENGGESAKKSTNVHVQGEKSVKVMQMDPWVIGIRIRERLRSVLLQNVRFR